MKPIDPRAAKPTWIESKSQDFERKRESLKTAPRPSLKINTPNMVRIRMTFVYYLNFRQIKPNGIDLLLNNVLLN